MKPYLLDSYLGTLGFSIAGGGSGEVDDWVVVGVLSAAVGVGALATTLASEGWEEVKMEMEMEELGRIKEGGTEEAEEKVRWTDGWTGEVFTSVGGGGEFYRRG